VKETHFDHKKLPDLPSESRDLDLRNSIYSISLDWLKGTFTTEKPLFLMGKTMAFQGTVDLLQSDHHPGWLGSLRPESREVNQPLPFGKRLQNYGKSQFLMGNSTITMENHNF